jgi:hypothetical protein
MKSTAHLPLIAAGGAAVFEAAVQMGAQAHAALATEFTAAGVALMIPPVLRWVRPGPHIDRLNPPHSEIAVYAGEGVKNAPDLVSFIRSHFSVLGDWLMSEKIIRRHVMLQAHAFNRFSLVAAQNGDDIVGVSELWTLKAESMAKFRAGELDESKLSRSDFVSEREDCEVYAAVTCPPASKGVNSTIALGRLMRGTTWALENGVLKHHQRVRVNALSVGNEGVAVLEKLGFERSEGALTRKRHHQWWTANIDLPYLQMVYKQTGLNRTGGTLVID